jgi:hypothetical protein
MLKIEKCESVECYKRGYGSKGKGELKGEPKKSISNRQNRTKTRAYGNLPSGTKGSKIKIPVCRERANRDNGRSKG